LREQAYIYSAKRSGASVAFRRPSKGAKQSIHEVIVYCKANPDAKVVDAVDAYVQKVQQGGQ
jgi:hypothetical protein